MNHRALTVILLPTMLALSLHASAQSPKESAKPTDEAQMRKQCEDMKHMDMSKMSAAEHQAMMKKCQDLMNKDKAKQRPKDDENR